MADVKEKVAENSEATAAKHSFDPKKIKTTLTLTVLPNPGKDGKYRLQILEERKYGSFSIESRTGFRELETEAAGYEAIELINAGVFKVAFGAQQGQAFRVSLVPVTGATAVAQEEEQA